MFKCVRNPVCLLCFKAIKKLKTEFWPHHFLYMENICLPITFKPTIGFTFVKWISHCVFPTPTSSNKSPNKGFTSSSNSLNVHSNKMLNVWKQSDTFLYMSALHTRLRDHLYAGMYVWLSRVVRINATKMNAFSLIVCVVINIEVSQDQTSLPSSF